MEKPDPCLIVTPVRTLEGYPDPTNESCVDNMVRRRFRDPLEDKVHPTISKPPRVEANGRKASSETVRYITNYA